MLWELVNYMFYKFQNFKRFIIPTYYLLLFQENEYRKYQADLLFPPAIILLSFYFSTFGLLFTTLFLGIILPASFYTLDRYFHFQTNSNKISYPCSCFYISWTITSFVILLYVFEFVVVPFLEITIWENYTLLAFVTISVSIIIYIRYRNKCDSLEIVHYQATKANSKLLFFNKWVSTNITNEHFKLYLLSLFSVICALIFGTYLSITTICHTTLQFDFLLVPDDCSEIYFDINLSLSFISAIYASMLVVAILYSLIRLLFENVFISQKNYYNLVLSD